MDYIEPLQQLANEEILIVLAMLGHWEVYSKLDNGDRLYITPFDVDFKNRFLSILEADKTKSQSLDLSLEEYNQIFMKYLQMSQSNILRIDEEYKNLRYHTIPKNVNVA